MRAEQPSGDVLTSEIGLGLLGGLCVSPALFVGVLEQTWHRQPYFHAGAR